MNDYGTPVPSQLVFGVGVSNLCADITTTDDDVYEGNETFLVSLFSTTGNVGNTATVLIIDNDDGMHFLLTVKLTRPPGHPYIESTTLFFYLGLGYT